MVMNSCVLVQTTTSGSYRNVCVQLRLYNLAVASIERCEALAEMEGSGGIGVDPLAGPAFKILKQLVHNWLTDAMQNGNRYAWLSFVRLSGVTSMIGSIHFSSSQLSFKWRSLVGGHSRRRAA